jgi:signal transduction histidine kinase
MKKIDADGEALVAIISRDVTNKRLLEQRLIASERLEALGRLAGSIAHDFNNLLTVMGGAAELARADLPEGHPAHHELDTVLGATSTATRLTRQLLTFSRRQLTVPVELDLRAALEEQRELLDRMVGKRIQLDYDFAPDVARVSMPESHFEQLAMNLVVNGRDAMPAGGRLTVGLCMRQLASHEIESLSPGPYVEFRVTDEGTGIAADVLPHLFDPFFTTQGESGTGLGLATCRSTSRRRPAKAAPFGCCCPRRRGHPPKRLRSLPCGLRCIECWWWTTSVRCARPRPASCKRAATKYSRSTSTP